MKAKPISGFLITTFGALALIACAAVPLPPTDAFQAADAAITNADKEGAVEFAPLELKSARDKITQARSAVANEPNEQAVMQARQLADEARADADLASARARAGRAAVINAELQKNIDTLRQELKRSSGDAS